MSLTEGCQLFGIQQALAGIEDAVILFHTVVGCHFGSLAFKMSKDMRQVRQCSTIISDKEVVFGGEDSIRKAIEKIDELYDHKLIILISGCVSEMIGDDIESVLAEYPDREILYVNGAGFAGGYSQGFEKGLEALLPLMEKGLEKEERKLNIIGLEMDSYLKEGDMRELERILDGDFQLNFLASSSSLEELKKSSSASLNLVIDRGEGLAKLMEEEFDIPYERLDYPYGILGTFKLLEVLEEHFGLDYGEKKAAMMEEVRGPIEKVYGYLQSLYSIPVAVLGSRSRASGMAYFLEQELGMEIFELGFKEEMDLLEEFYDRLQGTDASILFGSSFDKDFALDNSMVHLAYDYPVFDRIDLTERTYVGSRGSLTILEDVLNKIHLSKTKRGALYQ